MRWILSVAAHFPIEFEAGRDVAELVQRFARRRVGRLVRSLIDVDSDMVLYVNFLFSLRHDAFSLYCA